MSDLSVFHLSGDQIQDLTAILSLIEETFLEIRFDSDSNDPGVMQQETLELIQGEAEALLRELREEAEEVRVFGVEVPKMDE